MKEKGGLKGRAMLDVKSLFTMTIDVPQGMHSDREGKDIDSSERLKQWCRKAEPRLLFEHYTELQVQAANPRKRRMFFLLIFLKDFYCLPPILPFLYNIFSE